MRTLHESSEIVSAPATTAPAVPSAPVAGNRTLRKATQAGQSRKRSRPVSEAEREEQRRQERLAEIRLEEGLEEWYDLIPARAWF